MTESVFQQRVRAAGLSRWELGDLLGIHPHYLLPESAGYHERFDSLPVSVLIDLARRLDMHPADLVPELDSVLANGRPAAPAGTEDAAVADADARRVLTALAYAVQPLAVDDLAGVLDWPIERVTSALGHADAHPALGGPVALHRTAPDTYTVGARLDQLTAEQIRRLGQAQLYRHPLTAEQAHLLLAALALNAEPERYREQREAHRGAERDLQRAGLLHADSGPHQPHVVHDVRFSLRYFNRPDVGAEATDRAAEGH